MEELTDLEICKRIAEIEGVKELTLDEFGCYIPDYEEMENSGVDGLLMEYNPLTDDALCFRLMVKYDLDVIAPYRKNNETTWEAQIFSKDYVDVFQIYDKSANKAICLVIIEANK